MTVHLKGTALNLSGDGILSDYLAANKACQEPVDVDCPLSYRAGPGEFLITLRPLRGEIPPGVRLIVDLTAEFAPAATIVSNETVAAPWSDSWTAWSMRKIASR